MIRLVVLEIGKLIRRPRTFLGYLGVLLLLGPVILRFHYGDPSHFLRHQVGSDFEVVGTFFNALFLARMIMEPCLIFFLPLFVTLVAGDMVSGESAEGTLRALLVRPVGRTPVILAKFLVTTLHSLAVPLFLLLSSLLLGALFFGMGDLFILGESIFVIPMHEALLRLLGAYTAGALGMITIASFAFLISVLVENSNGAIIGAMMILIISTTLGELPYFENLRPYLFTTHMGLWRDFFSISIPWSEVGRSAIWLAGYTGACLAAALALFSRKDILS